MADEQHDQTLRGKEETPSLRPYPGEFRSDPRFYPAPTKMADSPLIFFIHFYGGHQKVLRRHLNLVNELGYDAFAFNLPSFEQKKNSLWVRREFGLKHLYADMIRFFSDQIPGRKVLFSFSNPSAAAIEILAEKFQKNQAQGFEGLINKCVG